METNFINDLATFDTSRYESESFSVKEFVKDGKLEIPLSYFIFDWGYDLKEIRINALVNCEELCDSYIKNRQASTRAYINGDDSLMEEIDEALSEDMIAAHKYSEWIDETMEKIEEELQ